MTKLKDAARAALGQAIWNEYNAKSGPYTISEAAADAVTPLIDHATNSEPWYQSRVTWGAIAAIAVPLLGVVGVGSDIITAEELTVWGMAAGSAAGGVLTLYGRWRAKKPMGA